MHGSSLARMAWFVEQWLKPGTEQQKVLDVGSCDVAGGTYRQFFDPGHFKYTGLDMAPGPNVDFVPAKPYFWSELASDSFDVVISGQAFEHMEFFWLAALEMARVLKPAGLMCLVCPRGFELHRYPVDCYRFDSDGMIAIARWCNLEVLHASTDMQPPDAKPGWHIENCEDSLLVAKKPPDWKGPVDPQNYEFKQPGESAGDFAACPKLMPQPVVPEAQYLELKGNAAKRESELLAELEALQQRLAGFEASRSWRVTAPLRFLGRLARAGLKR